jgi:RNA polymerase sigma-70 factor (ECF subfamily)
MSNVAIPLTTPITVPVESLERGAAGAGASALAFPVGKQAAARLIHQEIANTRTRERLVASATRILGNDSDAEDCVQEALMLAARNAEQFEGRSSAFSWLYRVVLNACRMQRRAERRDRRGGGAVHVTLDELVAAPMSEAESDPEAQLVGHETLSLLADELGHVQASDARLFSLHVLEDVPLAQLAEDHDLTRQAVKSRLFRVRRRLAERLASESGVARAALTVEA